MHFVQSFYIEYVDKSKVGALKEVNNKVMFFINTAVYRRVNASIIPWTLVPKTKRLWTKVRVIGGASFTAVNRRVNNFQSF